MPHSRAENSVTGLLLAGGRSRRMAPAFAGMTGGDKGLLDLAGKPMLAHVIERLRPQVGPIVLSANGDLGRFAPFGLPIVPDTIEGSVGPLAGVLAGLRWSAANAPQARFVASVSTDAPFLPENLVECLLAGLADGAGSIALASSAGELHPVIGLWPVALADDLEAALRGGVRKVLAFTDQHGTVAVEFPLQEVRGRAVDPFFNANTPEELDEARVLLQI